MFLTPWQQFFADEWPGQLVHLVAPFAILRLLLLDSPPLRFSRDAIISPKDLVMVDFKEGREEKSKSLTVPIAATWSSRQLAPCQFRRCTVWFVLRKFSAKKFLCSQWALEDYCLGAFILEGKMRVVLRIFAFFLRKILSLTDSSKCGICTDQSDCKCFLTWLQSAHYDEAEPEFFHVSLNRL